MTSRLTKAALLLRDVFWWVFCWLCWRTYTWMPWPLCGTRFGFWILGFAGMYAYCTDWADFRDCCPPGHRQRALKETGK